MSEVGSLLKAAFASADKYASGTEKWRHLMLAKAQALAEKYDISDPDGRDDLLIAAIEWDLSRNDKTQNLWIHRYFWPRIRDLTGADLDYVLDLTEEVREKQKHNKYQHALAEATEAAKEALEAGKSEIAKQALEEGLIRAERALRDTVERPIVTVEESIPWLFRNLAQTQGMTTTGMIQKEIPELDQATGGVQGLNLITGKSGEGKTMLALQTGLRILEHQDDVCLLIVSLDMSQERVLVRLLTNLSGLSINAVRTGTTPEGWTEGERERILQARKRLESFGRRIRILDRQNFPVATTSNISKEATRLIRDTGASQCLLIVDFFNMLPAPPTVPRDEKDEYRIDEMKSLVEVDGHTMLLITEATKYDNAAVSGADAGGAANVKGSNYIVMRADLVWILRAMRTDQLNEFFTINEEDYVERRLSKPKAKDTGGNRDEREDRANRIRNELSRAGKAAIWLKIDKARDGADKTEFPLINHFKKNIISPHLNLS